jgi:hypothetical protein
MSAVYEHSECSVEYSTTIPDDIAWSSLSMANSWVTWCREREYSEHRVRCMTVYDEYNVQCMVSTVHSVEWCIVNSMSAYINSMATILVWLL